MKPKYRRLLALPVAAVCVLSLASTALADNVTLMANDAANTTSFNTAGQWNNATAPAPAHDYFTANFTLRTPTVASGDFTFDGNSLTIDAGGRLLGKSLGSITLNFPNGNGLILNGGAFYQANSSTTSHSMTVTGKITANEGTSTFIGAAGSLSGTTNSETLDIQASLSGSGNLTVAGSTNNGDNTGITRISSANPDFTGVVVVGQPDLISSVTHRLLQLNNVNALQNAILTLNTNAANPNPVSFASAVNTGSFNIGGLSGGAAQRLVDTADAPVTLNVGAANFGTVYSGALSGTGSLVKTGASLQTLNGFVTYTGGTTLNDGSLTFGGGGLHPGAITVNAGTLAINNVLVQTGNTTVNSGTLSMRYPTLSDASTLTIANGATIQLDHGTTDKVTTLVLGGSPKLPGVYDENNSGGFITGTGSIEVLSGPATSLDVVMIANDANTATETTSINGDIGNWSVPGTPAAGNHYYTGPFTLRTPATAVDQSLTFGGSTLSLTTGGRLLGKAGFNNANNTSTQTLNVNLILDGGNIDQAGGSVNTTLRIEGSVLSKSEASVGSLGTATVCETLDFVAPISGDSIINVGGSANGGANRGVVRLSAANPFTGTFNVAQPGAAIASTTNRLLQINHPDALRFAQLQLLTTEADGLSFTSAANTGNFRIARIAGPSTTIQKLEDTAGSPVTLEIGGTGESSEFNGSFTGAGGIVKTGDGILTFSGEHSYQGNTTVTGGSLAMDFPSLSDTGTLRLDAGVALELYHSATDIVGSLILDGEVMDPGTYDQNNSDGLIVGSGSIEVTGVPSGGFSSFMDGFPGLSAADKAPDADPDKDGISNLVEYALAGFNPTVPGSLAGTLVSGTLTFTKRPEAVANDDILYAIETSTTLGAAPGSWTPATPAVNDSTTLSFTLPPGQGKLFARMRITRK